jgi:hypothetical protein
MDPCYKQWQDDDFNMAVGEMNFREKTSVFHNLSHQLTAK